MRKVQVEERIWGPNHKLVISSKLGVMVYRNHRGQVRVMIRCPNCEVVKSLSKFGVRTMRDGHLRNQPWCIPCRGEANR